MGFLLNVPINFKGIEISQPYVNIRVRDFKPKKRLNFVAQYYINQIASDTDDLGNLFYDKSYCLRSDNILFEQYFSNDIMLQANNDLIKQCYEYLKGVDPIFSNAQDA